ncbi:hypothetical protein PAHAL_1G038500 [Panicum hallii]|uniref:Uncharacterized protein n=1 Tax=Panicum hallii TaxID=206008 RepID=A0A2T8KTU9_9POAL|nr:hypothetical protein PAHAL_1G038500 [Panicum hallii]PVH65614.1 hypothetical protein PAHAL_1G038500 [Panicum hallii]
MAHMVHRPFQVPSMERCGRTPCISICISTSAVRTLCKTGARGEAAAVERIAFVSANAGFADLL